MNNYRLLLIVVSLLYIYMYMCVCVCLAGKQIRYLRVHEITVWRYNVHGFAGDRN